MFKYLRRKWMGFWSIFKDENDINEKAVIGFISFAIMVIFAFADLITKHRTRAQLAQKTWASTAGVSLFRAL